MNKRIALLGVYNYTVILTYISLLVAVFGISLAVRGDICNALICLMVSGVCDMFDGTIARTRESSNEQKCFGIQIDSLCDLICFGVLPMIIVYESTAHSAILLSAASAYVICAVIRLAYFNVEEAMRSSQTTEARSSYLGLPVTSAALIFPLLFICKSFLSASTNACLIVASLIIGLCFILPFHIKKPKLRGKLLMIALGTLEFILLLVVGL